MTMGTGIFLAAVVLGSVLLYAQTKDRWHWRRLVLRGLFTVIALVLLLGGGVWLYERWSNRVLPLDNYMGIVLSDSAADIKFKKGEPKSTEGNAWTYVNASGDSEWAVLFKGGEIRAVLYAGDCGYCNSINGLGINSSYDEVIRKLGPPSYTSASEDQLMRLASFENLNCVFQFAEGKVIAMGMYAKKFGPMKFAEDPTYKPGGD
jgi:hypothetical protein